MSPSPSAPDAAEPSPSRPAESAPPRGDASAADAPGEGGGAAPRRVRDTERAPPPPSGLDPGAIIADRYRIVSLLGEGGMGKVYRAEHVHMRKQVAVKVLHNDVTTTPEVVARFEREAVAAGNISHPNVAQATDFGRLEDGSFFLVLEFVPGDDLRTLVKFGPMPPERAVRIVRQIVAAAQAAHSAGVIHRDLKPENIMLVEGRGEEDFIKVLDFGIAKIDAVGLVDPEGLTHGPLSGPQPITKIGTVFGTPDYMSPEQALGQPIDARADLYSIGIILYELLSGERPFRGGAVSLMRKHVLQDAPPLPPDIAGVSDPALQVILTKLLQKSPSDRYADAAELGAALDLVVAKAPRPATTGPSAPVHPAAPTRTPSAPGSTLPALPLARSKRGSLVPWLFLGGVTLLAGGLTWARYRLPSDVAPVAASASPSSVALSAADPAALQLSPGTGSALAVGSASSVPSPLAPPPSVGSAGSAADAGAATNEDAQAPEADDPAVAAAADETEATSASAGAHTALGQTGGAHHGASRPAHSGGTHRKPPAHPAGRHTGPGGIYIPPPSQWFK